MLIGKIFRSSAWGNLRLQIFCRDLWDEKASQWYFDTKTKFLKGDFDCICKDKRGDVYGLSKIQCFSQGQIILILRDN
jgi:hypothetical protein